jgi:hypothetical protein
MRLEDKRIAMMIKLPLVILGAASALALFLFAATSSPHAADASCNPGRPNIVSGGSNNNWYSGWIRNKTPFVAHT